MLLPGSTLALEINSAAFFTIWHMRSNLTILSDFGVPDSLDSKEDFLAEVDPLSAKLARALSANFDFPAQ